jgi:hypothetical protein
LDDKVKGIYAGLAMVVMTCIEIRQEPLVDDVKGIYAGLVMVEKKCVGIMSSQSELPASSPTTSGKL